MSKSSRFNPITFTPQDGLQTPIIGNWALNKYRLVGTYMNMFTSSMYKSWDKLIYIDLFAGAGLAKIKKENSFVKTSPLIAASLPNKFSKYYFCELNKNRFSALQQRLKNSHPDLDYKLYNENANNAVNKIAEELEQIRHNYSFLTFCFIDPFSLNINFETIKKLSNYKMDFLILLALRMDAGRNLHNYILKHDTKIEKFLGEKRWRAKFEAYGAPTPDNFRKFLASEYKNKMDSLGFEIDNNSAKVIKVQERNLSLYHLAFFSKHPLGNNFFNISKNYSDNQTSFDF